MRKLILALVFALAACANLGAPAPQSTGQSIYYAESVYVAAMQSADNALQVGTLSKAQGQQVAAIAAQIDAALTAAKAADLAGNAATAQNQLAAANAAILQLQQYLAAQGVKK